MRDPGGLRRGFSSALASVALLMVAAFPSRLSLAVRGWGSIGGRVQKALGGTLLDLAAVIVLVAPLVAVVALVTPLAIRKLRGAWWQRLGVMAAAFPFGFAVWTLTVTAQEVKSERGSFPTTFDLLEGGTNASFLEGTVGYLRYERIWEPAVAGLLLAAVLVFFAWRRRHEAVEWRSWATGVVGGLFIGSGVVLFGSAGLAAASNSFSAAALGDPMTTIFESSIDMLQSRGPATPRELVLTAELPAGTADLGARRLGWPALKDGKRARPLDWSKEPATRDPRGRALLDAMGRVSSQLFADGDGRVAVFHLSLEGFRSDDVHALNAAAPKEIAPFTSSLYEKKPGVLASRSTYQAGVRTAHCLGAMTCGLGALPYNLSFIRDLQPFPVRCTSDVLGEAGFAHAFFYGSDAHFDEMAKFFTEHRYEAIRSQAELPTHLPKGTWDGVTDFAVFDAAVSEVAQGLTQRPQFALVMSLSNHSPFTTPEDLPPEVSARVDAALKTAVHRADADDRLRLITYSYTDAAVERLWTQLSEKGIAERSLVVLMADHSTGHSYVWGATDPETDAAKSQIPFAVLVPEAWLARARDRAALEAALAEAQQLLDAAPLSQNDFPSLLLALLSAHPGVAALPEPARWHTLGGQVTSPWFEPGGPEASYILGINGVSELYALDRSGQRVGGYEDSVFLKTRADRYRVTPRLIPVTATLIEVMRSSK